MSRKALSFDAPPGLYRLPSSHWRDDAIDLDLGRKVMVEVEERTPRGPRKVMRARKLYTYEEIDKIRAHRAERKQRALEANGGEYLVRDRAATEKRAEEYAQRLISDGYSPSVARARARVAGGLQDRAPDGDPRMTREMRRAWLDEAATSRRSERLPSVEGRTSGSMGVRR